MKKYSDEQINLLKIMNPRMGSKLEALNNIKKERPLTNEELDEWNSIVFLMMFA